MVTHCCLLQPMSARLALSVLISALLLLTPGSASERKVEWWGDHRQWELPNDAHPFYDLQYDDTMCPEGGELTANAVPNYVYFGVMIGAQTVDDSAECLRLCFDNTECHAVNYYKPMTFQQKGFCEQLQGTQWDRPVWMRRFTNAIYYDKITCGAVDLPTPGDNGMSGRKKVSQPTPLFVKKLYEKIRQLAQRLRRRKLRR